LIRIQDPPEEAAQTISADVQRSAVAAKISQLKSSFGYSPTWLLSIITAPLCLRFFSLPLYLFGPLSMGLLAYIKSDKDKQDTSLARGIMSDPNVSSHLLSHLSPSLTHIGS
jgi:hypothetical protein